MVPCSTSTLHVSPRGLPFSRFQDPSAYCYKLTSIQCKWTGCFIWLDLLFQRMRRGKQLSCSILMIMWLFYERAMGMTVEWNIPWCSIQFSNVEDVQTSLPLSFPAMKLKIVSVKRSWLRATDRGKMQTEIKMRTAHYRLQKYVLCYDNSIRQWSYLNLTTDFIDTRVLIWGLNKTLASIWHFSSVNHAFLIWCYACRDAPLVFNIWRPLCSLFVEHGYLLFSKFTLASGALLEQKFNVSIIGRFRESTCTKIHPRMISHPGREKKDKWTVEGKRSKLEE